MSGAVRADLRRSGRRLGWRSLAVLAIAMLALSSARATSADDGASVRARVVVAALEVEVHAPESVEAGESFRVEAEVHNPGPAWFSSFTARLHFDDEGISVLQEGEEFTTRGPVERRGGALRPGTTRTVRWARVTATEPGTYILQVTVEAVERSTGSPLTVTGSTMIEVNESSGQAHDSATDRGGEAGAGAWFAYRQLRAWRAARSARVGSVRGRGDSIEEAEADGNASRGPGREVLIPATLSDGAGSSTPGA